MQYDIRANRSNLSPIFDLAILIFLGNLCSGSRYNPPAFFFSRLRIANAIPPPHSPSALGPRHTTHTPPTRDRSAPPIEQETGFPPSTQPLPRLRTLLAPGYFQRCYGCVFAILLPTLQRQLGLLIILFYPRGVLNINKKQSHAEGEAGVEPPHAHMGGRSSWGDRCRRRHRVVLGQVSYARERRPSMHTFYPLSAGVYLLPADPFRFWAIRDMHDHSQLFGRKYKERLPIQV